MLRMGSVRLGIIIVLATLGAVGLAFLFSGGQMFSPGGLQAKPRLVKHESGGVRSHAEIASNCSACHAGLFSRDVQADRCLACHTDVADQISMGRSLHSRIADVHECQRCHTEHQGATAQITDFASFDHHLTDFPLTGKHQSISCQRCHQDQTYQGTSQSCVSCHAEPLIHRGKFGQECAQCHDANSWKSVDLRPELLAGFDHDLTGFKLTGGHRAVSCTKCHVDQIFKGTAKTCVSCHAEPLVHRGKFGQECAQCHSVDTWKNVDLRPEFLAGFDHDLTGFKLTGGHRGVSCAQCHVDQVFRRTAKTCVSCHAEPLVHRGQFGIDCDNCHSTATWKGARIEHKFPLNHGGAARKGANSCVICHTEAPDYKTYTCYGCHAHQPEKIAREHRKLTAIELQDCVRCHPTGREEEHRRGRDRGEKRRLEDGERKGSGREDDD